MKMIKETTLSPHQAPDLFSRRTSKWYILKKMKEINLW